jgi:hypothetical protein
MRLPFLLVFLLLLLLTGSAGAQNAPSAVRDGMPPGAISLRYETRELDGERVGIHHYVLPKGRHPEYENLRGSPSPTGPITRDEITPGPILKESPFYVDVYSLAGGKPTRLHSVTYNDEGDISALRVRYLRPKEKRGPILLLEGGYTHWKSWVLLIFPDGIRGKRATVQDFLWGGEGETYILQQFDTTDPRGFLQVTEEERESEADPIKRRVYRWDGERFTDPEARFFVIAATSKKRAEMDDFLKRKVVVHGAHIVRSDRYPKLTPGLYVVVLGRHRTLAEAREMAKTQKQAGYDCYVKQAF